MLKIQAATTRMTSMRMPKVWPLLMAGSIGAALVAAQQGAMIIRVHDVAETVDAHGFDRHGKKPGDRPNPMTGPFFVDGAKPGDTLQVFPPQGLFTLPAPAAAVPTMRPSPTPWEPASSCPSAGSCGSAGSCSGCSRSPCSWRSSSRRRRRPSTATGAMSSAPCL